MGKWRQMIDIETLAVGPRAQIMSVGGVRFNCETKEFKDEFLLCVDIQDCMERYKFDVHQDTIKWWMQQRPEVLKSQMQNKQPIEDVVDYLYSWFVPNQEVWCWGLSFDLPILENTFRTINKTEMPWKYYNQRCARTIAEVFNIKKENAEDTYHNAMEDCKAQCQVLFQIFDE